jgi:hypothetical protein
MNTLSIHQFSLPEQITCPFVDENYCTRQAGVPPRAKAESKKTPQHIRLGLSEIPLPTPPQMKEERIFDYKDGIFKRVSVPETLPQLYPNRIKCVT